MLSADSLREHFLHSVNSMDNAQLVTVLPFTALYIPQIAVEVAGALARRCGGTNNASSTSTTTPINKTSSSSSTNGETSSSSNTNNNSNNNNNNNIISGTGDGMAAIPSIISLISERFHQLCDGKWLEINGEVRETVSSILLADMIDPSMTTQTVQLLSEHTDKLTGFFAALFNWGVSDIVLARLKAIYERIPVDVRHQHFTQQQQQQELTAEEQLNNPSAIQDPTAPYVRDLQLLEKSCSVFLKNSNVRQGALAERCVAVVRIVSDPIVTAAIESLNEFTDPKIVWDFFVSLYKLFSNAIISTEVTQQAIATLGNFFRDDQRLKAALNDKVENIVFLLETGSEETSGVNFWLTKYLKRNL
jgi:hypothetical protein